MTKMMLTMVVALTATMGGCMTSTEQTLADGGLRAYVNTGDATSRVVVVELSRTHRPASEGNECAILSDSIELTANGKPGTLTQTGGYSSDEGGCTPARLEIPFDPIPDDIAITIDDGSARLHVTVARNEQHNFQVTLCELAACSASY